MPANIEVKASVKDVEEVKKLVIGLSGGEPTIINQQDTFFNVPNGRLKLRKLEGEKSELIYYNRSNHPGPRLCDYSYSNTDDPESLEVTLGSALGIKGKVKKVRLLYMVGQTRIHVDNVDGLGTFMELEVVMKDGQSMEEGQSIANDLLDKLGVKQSDLIPCAYMDLILSNKTA